MEGDTVEALAAYRDILRLWKDAGLDIPILIAPNSEFTMLE
jgi:hypothetical protein